MNSTSLSNSLCYLREKTTNNYAARVCKIRLNGCWTWMLILLSGNLFAADPQMPPAVAPAIVMSKPASAPQFVEVDGTNILRGWTNNFPASISSEEVAYVWLGTNLCVCTVGYWDTNRIYNQTFTPTNDEPWVTGGHLTNGVLTVDYYAPRWPLGGTYPDSVELAMQADATSLSIRVVELLGANKVDLSDAMPLTTNFPFWQEQFCFTDSTPHRYYRVEEILFSSYQDMTNAWPSLTQ